MDDKIKIPIGLDTSGVSADIRKASDQVGKASVGLTRGLSAALGAQLGPFSELIEKADAFKSALGGITGASRLFALATAGAGAAAVFGVMKAVDAYKEMEKAIDDATDAAERLKKASILTPENILREGVAPGQEDRAIQAIDTARRNLVGENISDEQRAAFDRAREFVISGDATRQYQRTAFERTLSPESRRMIQEEADLMKYGDKTVGELSKIRADAEREFNQAVTKGGGEDAAIQANAAQELIKKMDEFISARMQADEDEKRMMKEQADRDEAKAKEVLSTFFDGSFDRKAQMTTVEAQSFVPSSFGVGGYTATGGGGNIYGGAREGMETVVKGIATDVKRIAENIQSTDGGLAP